jgi:hypothetical protein
LRHVKDPVEVEIAGQTDRPFLAHFRH